MKKTLMTILSLILAAAVAACGILPGEQTVSPEQTGESASVPAASVPTPTGAPAESSAEPSSPADAESNKVVIDSDFTAAVYDGGTLKQEGDVFLITSAGTYVLSGVLDDGQIRVEAGEEDKVTIELAGASLSCSTDSPIYALTADKVKIKVIEGTYNEIHDLRTDYDDSEGSEDGRAACYAKTDLSLSGQGSLVVESSCNNGIHTTKDLEIKNLTLKVTCPNNALKGNDSVTVESGNLILISTGGDGIQTEDSNISTKGNQRGTISVLGGNIQIFAACDGLDAAYDAVISGEASLDIRTGKYSEYSEDVSSSGSTEMYLILSASDYSSSKTYAAYFYTEGNEEKGSWEQAVYSTAIRSGRTSYSGLLLKIPAGVTRMEFYIFTGAAYSRTEYEAKSEPITVNRSMNGYLVSSASGGVIRGDFVTVGQSGSRPGGGGPGGPGGSQKQTLAYSCKGIKADNEILIESGTVVIQSTDDALHANGDVILGNGAAGTGNVTVTGGTVELTTEDDAVHADQALTVSGGTLRVVTSAEGLEGNVVTVSGGSVYVYATDDGVNATSGKNTPYVYVHGGYLEITTSSGDTDGIDSNGYYEQTGGLVVIRGGSSMGSVSGSLDTDRTVTVKGGTIIALGGICTTPSGNNCRTVIFQRQSFGAGTYRLTDKAGSVIAEFTLEAGTGGCWISSEAFEGGGSYTITKDGNSFLSWTQNSQTQKQ